MGRWIPVSGGSASLQNGLTWAPVGVAADRGIVVRQSKASRLIRGNNHYRFLLYCYKERRVKALIAQHVPVFPPLSPPPICDRFFNGDDTRHVVTKPGRQLLRVSPVLPTGE
jgi:hypothetical protein